MHFWHGQSVGDLLAGISMAPIAVDGSDYNLLLLR